MVFRLYMDEDSLHEAILGALRRDGFDCLTTDEAGRRTTSDEQQLEFAAEIGRVIFTHNTGHFADLHKQWVSEGRQHSGIIVLTTQVTGVGVIQRALRSIAEQFDSESIRNEMIYLRNFIA